MPLPSSGPISMGDINVELGRSRTTANTALAGGSTPSAGSLFGLAGSSVNKTAPHRISEFYGYSNASTLQMDIYVNEPDFFAYGAVYYNNFGGSLIQDGFGYSGNTVTLSPAAQTVFAEAFNDNPLFLTVGIETYVNSTFIASYYSEGYVNADLVTSAGNAYGVIVYVF
jgi:hypothetical protein